MKQHPIKSIRRAAVPLACFETQDPAACIQSCCKELNGKSDSIPIMQWDIINGLSGINRMGKDTAQDIAPDGPIQSGNPSECLSLLGKQAPEDSLIFFHNAHRYVANESVAQGIWNCRDQFKTKGSSLILLCPSINLPEELKQDVVIISEPYPTKEEVSEVVDSICKDAGLDVQKIERKDSVIETLMGLSRFGAEQILAMSLSKEGINLEFLRELKRTFLQKTAGLEVRKDTMTFSDIAGYENIKQALTRKIRGKRPPQMILWMDEIEKAFAGSKSDTSGVSQDQLGVWLTWMQDKLNRDELSAVLLVGFPGTGKSAVAMASRNEAGCDLIRVDMGAAKGSLVGESEAKIRRMTGMIDAMGGGHILLIGTANSVTQLPSPLMSRFAFGTYFFDLPTWQESKSLWDLKRKKYDIPEGESNPQSEGWTGREIQQCCFLADDLQITLEEASCYISPFCKSGRDEITMLRNQASGKFISANYPGLYNMAETNKTGRKIRE